MGQKRIVVVVLLSLVLIACEKKAPGPQDPGSDAGVDASGATCGNSVVEANEDCDDGPQNSDVTPDACRTDCRRATCGDQVTDTGEQCDDGPQNSDTVPDACRRDCTTPRCGDNVVDVQAGESCDDGNAVAGDGCGPNCQVEYCGNGLLDPGEVCDDGNFVAGDGCAPDCLSDESCGNGIPDLATGEQCDCGTDATNLPAGCTAINGDPASECESDCRNRFCGNGVVNPGEVCDDGNGLSGDGCSSDCRSDESCGNGITDLAAQESCDCGTDPANLPSGCTAINGDAASECSGICQLRYCGNGTLDPGEVCDDGNPVAGDGCSPDCRSLETCGNGITDILAGETCDCGSTLASKPASCAGINGAAGSGCAANCVTIFCGNGQLDPGEICDDGNNLSGDDCSADCVSLEVCGNGIPDFAVGENCDDGNTDAGDGCGPNCRIEVCGNGNVDIGEVCDDGNNASGDGCSGDCLSDESCGNSIVDFAAGESCDDGGRIGGDGCSATCRLESCGNGTIDVGEACDDGNNVSGDSCSADCLSDESCPNGVADFAAGETCDDGNTTPGDGCGPTCQLEYCGNNIVDQGEVCDDGNRVSGDNCSADCLSNETCGNGYVDLAKGEGCDCGTDGANLPSGCTAINGAPTGECSATCQLRFCGNGVTDPGEVCDDGDNDSGDGCSADCLSTEGCGNGYIDVATGELCDDGAGNANTPNAACRTDCQPRRCGDGIRDDASGEACDTAALGGATCTSLGYYTGTLSCSANCQYDLSACSGRCGDGAKDSSEACDGGDFGGVSCTDYGFYTGQLACNAGCDTIDTAGCSQTCGDGVRNGPELCDNASFGGLTCGTYGYYAGNLSCGGNCDTVSTAGCSGTCGDGVRNGPEVCDGADLGQLTCQSFGFHSGSLVCDPGCGTVDTSGCGEYCGDGIVNGPELCDGADQRGVHCVDFGYDGGAFGCDAFCQRTVTSCFEGGWTAFPSGTTEDLNGVYSISAIDTFAVGDNGTILHSDGYTWTAMTSGTTADLYGVWGAGPDDVWAVGQFGRILHYDGTTWTQAASVGGRLNKIWGTSASDIYAVGLSGKIMYYNGSWTEVTPAPTTEELTDVWASGPGDVYIVGTGGTILHGSALSWTPMDSGVTTWLRGIWGSGPNDIYIGGSSYTKALHYDGGVTTCSGRVWCEVTVGGGWITDLWGTSDTNIYAIGTSGILRHYDGSTWSDLSPGVSATLNGISGSGPSDVYFVGDAGTSRHFAGDSWQVDFSTNQGELQAVWGSSPTDIYATAAGEVLHYQGTTWNVESTGQPEELYDVWGADADNVFAVGQNGMILRRTGGSWGSPMTTDLGPTSIHLNGVWGVSASDAFAVGGTAPASTSWALLRFDGTSWSSMPPPAGAATRRPWGVFGFSANDVFVADWQTNDLLYYDGSSWTVSHTFSSKVFNIWGTSPSNLYVTGQGVVHHYDGIGWTSHTLGTSAFLWAIWGSAASDVFAAGTSGVLMHFDGVSWAPFTTGVTDTFRGLWGSGAGDVWAVGGIGNATAGTSTILHLQTVLPTRPGGQCQDPIALYCDTTYGGSNINQPSTFSSYAPCASAPDTGPEVYYQFLSPISGQVTVTMTPHEGNLDLIAVGPDAAGGCDPTAQCLEASQAAGTTQEQITRTVARGEALYFIVDGAAGATSGYTLTTSCVKQ